MQIVVLNHTFKQALTPSSVAEHGQARRGRIRFTSPGFSPYRNGAFSCLSVASNLQMLMDGRIALPLTWDRKGQPFTD